MNPVHALDIPLLAGLSAEEQRHILDCMSLIELAPGALLFAEGDPGDSLYIIASGEIDIIKARGTPEEHLLAVSSAGNFLGEVALLDVNGLRSASARARDRDATLLQMTAADFHRLMETRPTLATQMTRIISNRLRAAGDATIRDLEAKNRDLAHAYRELKTAHEQIIEKERLEKELEVARQIQLSMLPEALPQAEGFSFGACMRAARQLGGDFYDLFPLDEHRIAVAVGDVSDKGVPSALFMALTRSLLRAEALRPETTPAQTLRRVNTLLQEMSTSGLFVTVLYGVLDTHTGRFDYARAGHELPILARAGGALQPIPAATGQILGLLPEVLIDEAALTLAPGDLLLLFSDGASDAAGPLDQRFGYARLAQALQAGPRSNAQVACDAVLAAILAFQDRAAQFDDITLVTVLAGVHPAL